MTADAFSNRNGIVVDSFRFTDSFRTLEMNASEHEHFVKSVHDVVAGTMPVEKLLAGRRRGRRKAPKVEVTPRVQFDDQASSHSTLLEIVAQDVPGLLRSHSLTIARAGTQYRGRPDRYGRRDGHRRLLPDASGKASSRKSCSAPSRQTCSKRWSRMRIRRCELWLWTCFLLCASPVAGSVSRSLQGGCS